MRGIAGMLLGAFALIAVSHAALADTARFTGQLGPDDPVPGAQPSTAKGTATLSLDTGSKTVTWVIDYSGLSQAAAGVECGMLDSPNGPSINVTSNLASPVKGSKTLTDAEMSGLTAGHWVCLVGTSDDEAEIGGELRRAP
ncbi:MAG TPA: CHRD domain-containing protein [Stellaceae bacterium]|jgi:hypothetical protein|nr:CHRD domain-containing protein [Stellaceae bacterium]